MAQAQAQEYGRLRCPNIWSRSRRPRLIRLQSAVAPVRFNGSRGLFVDDAPDGVSCCRVCHRLIICNREFPGVNLEGTHDLPHIAYFTDAAGAQHTLVVCDAACARFWAASSGRTIKPARRPLAAAGPIADA